MMSLNGADALRRKLEEEHDFNAEQANGTLMIVDDMVDSGIDRVLKRIDDLESKMDNSIASLRSDMDSRFNVIDERFKVVDDRFDVIEKRFDSVDKRFDGVDARIDLVDSRIKERFDLIDGRLKTVATWQPIKGAASTIIGLAALVTFWLKFPDIIKLFS
ncbi:MAG: hypothetical protein OXG15_06270 [Gammaproteobacteria bacterium]|nr:hypothetical protein [Gammaproteobacteria bacterium]